MIFECSRIFLSQLAESLCYLYHTKIENKEKYKLPSLQGEILESNHLINHLKEKKVTDY